MVKQSFTAGCIACKEAAHGGKFVGYDVALSKKLGAIAQLGERRPCKAEATGSIPVSSTEKLDAFFIKLFFRLNLFFDNLKAKVKISIEMTLELNQELPVVGGDIWSSY